MDLIIIIGFITILILFTSVCLLSLKIYKYKNMCNRYESLEKSNLINDWTKYTPKLTSFEKNRENNISIDRLIADGIQGLPNSVNSHSHREKSDNTVKDSAGIWSRSEAKLSQTNKANNNNSDEIEISEFESINNELPAIDFKLVYVSQTSTLKVHIKRVSNLPLQLRKNCWSYVKISLITDSEKLSSFNTNVIKKSLNPEYEEDFAFSSLTFEDLRNLTIRVCVYVKRKQLSKRQLVGDLWVPLSRPDLEPDIELICREKLSLACPQTGKRGPLLMAGKLGFLFIQIEFQSEAKRLKVVIRKAQNLYNRSISYSNFQITKPEYYVIVNLLQNNETLVYKETKSSVGLSPVWNQPFLFDVSDSDINTFWIQCLVMQGKSYTKDGVIGQVLVGPNTTVSGIQHWNDVIGSEYFETSKWHPISSVGTACL